MEGKKKMIPPEELNRGYERKIVLQTIAKYALLDQELRHVTYDRAYDLVKTVARVLELLKRYGVTDLRDALGCIYEAGELAGYVCRGGYCEED